MTLIKTRPNLRLLLERRLVAGELAAFTVELECPKPLPVDAVPALTGRDVYVGIEGGVDKGDGTIALGRDTKLRIGDTRYSLANAAKRLNMSEAQLRESIEKELARMNVQIPAETE